MKLIINDIILRPNETSELIAEKLQTLYGINADVKYEILRKSLDARKKDSIVYRFRILVDVSDDQAESLLKQKHISIYKEKDIYYSSKIIHGEKVIIIGSGPAGLFCALRLIKAGAQVEIYERGKPIEERLKDINELENFGILNEQSNILFGEGGAGTYSDGKLTTRIRHREIEWFFHILVECGAPRQILYDAKPHLGTDRLRDIMQNIRKKILEAGSLISFNETMVDIIVSGEHTAGIITSKGNEYQTKKIVLAIGHSARDTYAMLLNRGIALEKKGFAVGIRVEHPAELIDSIQYGNSSYRDILPHAEYSLAYNNKKTNRGIYTFCMCPGGRIINSSSEQSRLCTNGMSCSSRNYPFSNSAIVVTVNSDDIGFGALNGITFQRDLESSAFFEGHGGFYAPAQRITSFIRGIIDSDLPAVSYKPGVFPVQLAKCFPEWIVHELKNGLNFFDKKMKGFISREGVLIGVETRTSSPVRILRGTDFQSVSIRGVYPIGEGAGYAGGIVSSAIDGIRCADYIIENL